MGGLSVVDAGRLVLTWAGRRNLMNDEVDRFTVDAQATVVEAAMRNDSAVLGGFGAAVGRLGANTIAGYDTVIVYGEPNLGPVPVDVHGRTTNVIVLQPDDRLSDYGNVTPLCQAWVDLFNLPGWQAARFVHALLPTITSDGAGLLSV